MARNNNAVYQRTGRYVQGGLTDVYNSRLGWWERTVFAKREDDIITHVRPGEAARPWLISYRIYNQDGLGWLVLQHNNIVDINEELIPGKRIRVPNPARVSLSILVNPTGGNPVTVTS